jgi:hypothetical protein
VRRNPLVFSRLRSGLCLPDAFITLVLDMKAFILLTFSLMWVWELSILEDEGNTLPRNFWIGLPIYIVSCTSRTESSAVLI